MPIMGVHLLNYIRRIRRSARKECSAEKHPPGHYYSVIPSLTEVEKRKADIFRKDANLYGIDLNSAEQIEQLKNFSKLYEPAQFFLPEKRIRFNIENDKFSYDDAPVLHYMMRLLKPQRIIEIGSGYSSACMLDTNDLYLNRKINFTFIDPNCNYLRANLLDGDYEMIAIIEKPVQEVGPAIFKKLKANDILFIDSSHIMKIGSDLHTVFFDILPLLQEGVYIHFHDIPYPFQYSEDLIKEKTFWNEAYVLRAFLQYNNSFKIFFWLNYLLNTHFDLVTNLAPFLPLENWARRFNNNKKDYTGAGGSIYLVKIK